MNQLKSYGRQLETMTRMTHYIHFLVLVSIDKRPSKFYILLFLIKTRHYFARIEFNVYFVCRGTWVCWKMNNCQIFRSNNNWFSSNLNVFSVSMSQVSDLNSSENIRLQMIAFGPKGLIVINDNILALMFNREKAIKHFAQFIYITHFYISVCMLFYIYPTVCFTLERSLFRSNQVS